MTPEPEAAFEYVFEQEVRAGKVGRFHALYDRLHELASRQPGFVRQERRLVSGDGAVMRFQTALTFDTAEHCIDWLENPERRRLLRIEEEEAGFAFRGHGDWAGYSRWLSNQVTTRPPTWKVNLLVLLTLYPTAMLLTPVLHFAMAGFGLPVTMLVSNILCVAATSWLLVPWVSRFTVRWLEGRLTSRGNALALAALVAILALQLAMFTLLPAGFWN
jgi:antibiotic biosynthesis monooxygenase (ABM) superfamily enzyme